MRTDLAFDKICDIIPIVCDIADKADKDKELHDLLIGGLKSKNVTRGMQLRFLVQVIKKCRDEAFEILAIIYDKSVDEVKEQDFFGVTIPQVVKLWNSDEVKELFLLFTKNKSADLTEEEKAADDSLPISENIAVETESAPVTLNPLSDF